jgi:hypothetical protein
MDFSESPELFTCFSRRIEPSGISGGCKRRDQMKKGGALKGTDAANSEPAKVKCPS